MNLTVSPGILNQRPAAPADPSRAAAWQDESTICLCHACGEAVAFSGDRAGEFVNCPRCMRETLLYVPAEKPALAPERIELTVAGFRWDLSPRRYRRLVGTVTNETACPLDWVRIDLLLLDGVDNYIGAASDSRLSLAPGEVWNFKALVFSPDVVRSNLPVLQTEFGKMAPALEMAEEYRRSPVETLRYSLDLSPLAGK